MTIVSVEEGVGMAQEGEVGEGAMVAVGTTGIVVVTRGAMVGGVGTIIGGGTIVTVTDTIREVEEGAASATMGIGEGHAVRGGIGIAERLDKCKPCRNSSLGPREMIVNIRRRAPLLYPQCLFDRVATPSARA